MRLLVVAACVGLQACAEAQASADCTRAGERCRGSKSGRPAAGGSGFQLIEDISFTGFGHQLPFVWTDPAGVALFIPNPDGGLFTGFNDGGFEMAGTDAGTVTFATGEFGRYILDVQDATKPGSGAAAIRSTLAADHLVMWWGYATTKGNASTQIWFEEYDGTRDVLAEGTGTSIKCSNDGMSHSAASDTAYGQGLNGWFVAWCRQTGNSLCAGINDVASENCITSAPVTLTGGNFLFGVGAGAGNATRGQLGGFAFWASGKSQAFVQQTVDRLWGIGQPEAVFGSGFAGVNQLVGKDNTSTTGQIDVYGPKSKMVDATNGIHTFRGFTNVVANPVDVSTLARVNDPQVTQNTAPGPLFNWKNTNAAGRVWNIDGGANRCVTLGSLPGLDGGAANSTWGNSTGFLFPGDAGDVTDRARIQYVWAGTIDGGNLDADGGCEITLAAGGGVRYPARGCYGWWDNPSLIRADLCTSGAVGSSASIFVAQTQLTAGLTPEPPTTENGAHGIGWFALDGGAVPFGAKKGKLEVVFKLPQSSNVWTPQSDSNKSVSSFLEDYFASANPAHVITHVYGNQAAVNGPAMLGIAYGKSQTQENYMVTSYPIDAGVWYVLAIDWQPSGSQCVARNYLNACPDQTLDAGCYATTQIHTGAFGECPDAGDTIYMGNRYDNTDQGTANFSALRVYR